MNSKFYGSITCERDYLAINRDFDRKTCLDIVKQFMLPHENFYIGNVLPFELTNIYHINDSFYQKVLFSFFNEKNKVKNTFDGDLLLAKWTNLVDIWFKEKKFNGLISSHWNPRTNKIIVHPGAQRIKIVNMFPLYEQKYIFFNTLGFYQTSWMDSLEIIDDVDSIAPKYKMGLSEIVPDHGSIIPHFTLISDYDVDKESIKYRDFIIDRLKNIKIFLENDNFKNNLSFIEENIVDNRDDATVLINIKDNPSGIFYNITRIVLCVITGKDFSDDIISIKNKNPLINE